MRVREAQQGVNSFTLLRESSNPCVVMRNRTSGKEEPPIRGEIASKWKGRRQNYGSSQRGFQFTREARRPASARKSFGDLSGSAVGVFDAAKHLRKG